MILGTTDKVAALDPAACYDLGCQQVIGNIYQTLLSVPAGGNTPEPDAAESCEFSDPKTFVCKLKAGPEVLEWGPADRRGRQVLARPDAQDRGPDRPVHAAGLAGLGRGDRSYDRDDEAQQGRRDLPVRAHAQRRRRSSRTRSTRPTRCRRRTRSIGSGPYKLDKYTPDQQAVFSANPEYTGPNKAKTPNFIVQYFGQPSALKLAIEQGEVDVAYRTLSPTDLESLKSTDGVQVVDGAGTEIRYMVFNVEKEPVKDVAIRKAIAQSIDRDAIAQTVYKGTTKPLYSTVPAAFPGAKESFKDAYGDPDPAKAKAILDEAGVSTPVTLDGWYTPSRYGAAEADMWNEIKRQLDGTNLFKVNLDSTEWDQYKEEAFAKGTYYMYGLGWFPDFPDADNYLTPFMRDGGFFQNGYSNKEVNGLLDDEVAADESVSARGGVRQDPGHPGRGRAGHPALGGQAGRRDPGRRRGRPGDVRPRLPVPFLAGDEEGELAG